MDWIENGMWPKEKSEGFQIWALNNWNTGFAFYRNWEDYLRNKTFSGCPGSNHCLCTYWIRGSLSWSNKGPSKYNGSQKNVYFPFTSYPWGQWRMLVAAIFHMAIQTPKFLPSYWFRITQVWSLHGELNLGHHQVLLGVHKSGTGRRGRTGHIIHAK